MTEDETDIDPEKLKAQLLSGYQSVPALDPPRDWKQVERAAFEEFALRNTLSGLPEESEAYKRFSARLSQFLESGQYEDPDDTERSNNDSGPG